MTSEVGFYYLRPEWRTNPAFSVFTLNGSDTTTEILNSKSQVQEFNFDPQFVPRVSLGVASEGGLGIRTNFWQFSNSSTKTIQDFTTTSTNTGSVFSVTGIISATPLSTGITPGNFFAFGTGTSTTNATFSANLRMVVWDVEVTDEIHAGRWRLTPAAGVRYAHISQNYDAAGNSPISLSGMSGTFTTVLQSGHNFNGAGPTVALGVQRQIGSSGFSFYATTRGSLLFGSVQQTVGASEIESFVGANAVTLSQANQDPNSFSTIPVLEIEVGARWERDWGRSRVYTQAGLVGQVWFGVGNSSRSTASSQLFNQFGFEEFGGGAGTAATVDNDLGLIGLSIQAGIQF